MVLLWGKGPVFSYWKNLNTLRFCTCNFHCPFIDPAVCFLLGHFIFCANIMSFFPDICACYLGKGCKNIR
jgi:hypothetical protein